MVMSVDSVSPLGSFPSFYFFVILDASSLGVSTSSSSVVTTSSSVVTTSSTGS